jgi:hypothetical protein
MKTRIGGYPDDHTCGNAWIWRGRDCKDLPPQHISSVSLYVSEPLPAVKLKLSPLGIGQITIIEMATITRLNLAPIMFVHQRCAPTPADDASGLKVDVAHLHSMICLCENDGFGLSAQTRTPVQTRVTNKANFTTDFDTAFSWARDVRMVNNGRPNCAGRQMSV